jgi:hypothetical protein
MHYQFHLLSLAAVLISLCGTHGNVRVVFGADAEHKPLVTRWAKDVTPDSVWPEYAKTGLT